jgi:hypothetical protein
MDHLKIQRAHIHGYSMGGGIVGSLLGMIPDRFITAGFGGSGMNETERDVSRRGGSDGRCAAEATGADAEGMERFRFARRRGKAGGQPGGGHRRHATCRAVSRSDEAPTSRSSR